MAGLIWILTVLCVAGCHLSSASPVLRSALVVQAGQNVSLTCNLTSSREITWYFLRSDQLLPLLTVTPSKVVEDTVVFHAEYVSRINNKGHLKSGLVGLEILEVEERDAGLYFCTGKCAEAVCVDRGIHLAVEGRPAVCCCPSVSSIRSQRVTEESLHYSSLKHADKPRPSGRGGTGLVEEDVTYSTVTSRKHPNKSHDHR
ncbi:uncharacterized protein [Enoplosus armatus]|uniref:uncharacterized protein isoform X2 n=1 Tax=Enoplosus armatus TaxID=215367 RepID=UPI003993FD47